MVDNDLAGEVDPCLSDTGLGFAIATVDDGLTSILAIVAADDGLANVTTDDC